MPSRALFLVNPSARRGAEGADRIAARLRALGLDLVVEPAEDPSRSARAAEVIAAGHRRRIDLGRVNGRYFCTTASIGLSVQITEELSPEVKRRWGPVAYALAVAPDATIDDARLDLYSLEVNHWWELVKLAPSLKRGTHVRRQEVEAMRARSFEVQTRRPMPIDLDGELGAETPARLEVVPRALEVFVPSPGLP